ncbi:hypothetical protein AXF42_Ash013352 [Apostasia shenzhenica]|uniref:Uncharacterized protein n=1 Tax=Apostasia shenzhenica TaxID=1088818 RepID=A0A2I0BBS7_9ASPA|nr:hypothetical protein AXF42_Ash013352 [Apostasia shenzhenica]
MHRGQLWLENLLLFAVLRLQRAAVLMGKDRKLWKAHCDILSNSWCAVFALGVV